MYAVLIKTTTPFVSFPVIRSEIVWKYSSQVVKWFNVSDISNQSNFSKLGPVQTDTIASFSFNNLQHCWIQDDTYVWLPCGMMLDNAERFFFFTFFLLINVVRYKDYSC